MRNLLRNNIVFIALSLMLLIALGLALYLIPKGELHFLLCNRHTPARDIFYRYYTQVAEWFPYVLCVLILLFSRIGDGVFASSAMILSALSTQALKHLFVAPRPVTWFASNCPDIQLPLVDGVQMNLWYSFPSGHTGSAFAVMGAIFLIALLGLPEIAKSGEFKQKKMSRTYKIWAVVAIVYACVLGFSRLYVGVHYPTDVIGGLLLGIATSFIAYFLFRSALKIYFERKAKKEAARQ